MKKILLCVSASISFYKAFEILSALKKLGFDVLVAMSENTFKFTNDIGFEALSGHKVLCEKNESWSEKVDHISYSKVDLVLIAPASANSISKIACGIADSVFLQTILASNAQKIIAPAANQNMLENAATKANLDILRNRGFIICEPVCKVLACGDVGKGALADVLDIVDSCVRALNSDQFWCGKKVVITGGATSEKIDDVRAITNFSSGKMAKALADAFYFAGADVFFITSREFKTPYKTAEFTSSKELLNAVNSQSDAYLLVMCAAVSDFVPKNEFTGKIKKNGSDINLVLKENIDILKSVSLKCKKIGFKMECEREFAEINARKTLENKALDAICLNILDENTFFGSDKSEVNFITKGGKNLLKLAHKEQIAHEIVKLSKNL